MNKHFAQWVALATLISFPQAAGAETPPKSPPASVSINVRVYDHARVGANTLERAKQTAARIFRQAGVRTNWFDCRLAHTDPPKDPQCGEPRGPADFVIKILPEEMAQRMGLPPTHFGFAPLPKTSGFASHASVFFHKVEELAEGRISLHAVILGHIMTHELGHLLLGSGSHARRGIMRAQWRDQELRFAVEGKLHFTPRQKKRLLRRLKQRLAALSRSGGRERQAR